MTPRTLTAMAVATVIATACSDDAAGPSGDRLTRAEAAVIAGDITANSDRAAAMPQVASMNDGTAGDPGTFTQELEINVACPVSGNIQQKWKVDASFDQEAGSFSLDIAGFQKHIACAFRHEGVTITVDGDPDVDLEAHVASANFRPTEHTLDVDGAFKWSASDGRSGTCPITLEAVTDFAARKRTVEGNVCGHAIRETTSWSN
jgi:hypothetical protein